MLLPEVRLVMTSRPDPRILFSPGPSGTFILLCRCGNNEVSRDRSTWQRFVPDFEAQSCLCRECRSDVPLTFNDDPHLYLQQSPGSS
ncbi:hypothetical protein GCM10009016_11620 [Halomonas beimenensis]